MDANSAKGADARRQARKKLACPLGGALNSSAVLREFLNSAKGADACRQDNIRNSGGHTEPVLREFFNRDQESGFMVFVRNDIKVGDARMEQNRRKAVRLAKPLFRLASPSRNQKHPR
jgi:hypothetical protein